MLAHIGQSKVGEKIQNAWLKTIEDGIHTADIYKEGVSKRKVSTQEFTAALIERLGQMPSTLKAVRIWRKRCTPTSKIPKKTCETQRTSWC